MFCSSLDLFGLIQYTLTDCPLQYSKSNAYPSWSNDGSKLAMVKGGNIYTVSVSNSDTPKVDLNSLSQLTTSGHNLFPDWSPDGEKIVYDKTLSDQGGSSGIWIMKANGGEPYYAFGAAVPSWDPVNQLIIAVKGVSPNSVETQFLVYEVASSVVIDTLSFSQNENLYPKYSSNEQNIVFYSKGDGPPSLCTIRSDGTELKTIFPEYAWRNDWSPDGSKLVFLYWDFLKKRPGSGHLWIVNADGTDPVQLTY